MEVTPHHHPQHPPLAAMDCYEDMFKEITRKLYGEEGLPENAQGPEGGGGADGGMRMMDYGEGGGGGGAGGGDAGSGALSAFGLALMHNGFQSPADMKFRAPVHPAHLNHHHLNHHLNHHHLANHHHHINHLANHHAHPLIHHAPVHHAPPPPTAHYASPPPPPPPQQQQQPPPPPPQQPSPAAAPTATVPTSTTPSSTSSNAGATVNAAASTPTTMGSTTPSAATNSNLPPSSDDKWLTSDDALPWTTSKIASYNPAQKLFKCSECDCVGFLSRVAEHWLGTHANLRVFQCPQCPYASAWARCVRMHLTRQHSGGEGGGGGGATTPNGTPQPPDSPQPYGADGNSSSSSASPSPWKENPVLEEVTKFLQALRSRVEEKGDGGGGGSGGGGFAPSTGGSAPRNGGGDGSGEPGTATATPTTGGRGSGKGGGRRGGGNNAAAASGNNSGGEKRYCCPACPYATDRRDLFTRHENIHRDEKPFQCYVCAKQFNRADHVKKHFLRMHRDHPYDLNKIRRSPPKNASGMSFYHKYNGGSGSGSEGGAPENSGSTTPGATNGNANNSRNVLQQPSHLQAPSIIPPPLAASLMHSNHHAHLGNTPQNHQHLGLHSTGNYQAPSTGKMGGGGKRNHQNGMKGNAISGNGPDAGTGKPKKPKKVGDKRYSCCYCAWSGADNWCLKRHLNTHIKPFLCPLCDYKAARSERLATHVLKVHNKRACAKCAFLGDDQLALSEHVQEHHPTEIKNTNRTSNNTLLRNVAFPCYQPPMSSSFCEASRGHRTLSDSTLLYRYNGCGRNNNRGGNGWRRGYGSQLGGRSWGPARNHPFSTSPRGKWCGGPLVRGAGKKVALGRGGSTSSGASKGSVVLKVGASGGGGGATVTLRGAEGRRLSQCAVCSFRSADERSMADHLRIRHGLPHRWGDTVRELRPFYTDQNASPTTDGGAKQTRTVVNLDGEEEDEDIEANKRKRRWPPYECRQCGCEFANKWSLENHIAMHHNSGNTQDMARFVKAPGERHPYICSVCGLATASQAAMMRHLRFHSGLSLRCKAGGGCIYETTSEAALVEHVRSSHDDKDFTARCPHCGHGSSTPAAYARHSAIHHPAALSSNGRHAGNFQGKRDVPEVENVSLEAQKDEQPCKMCAEVFLKHFFLSLEKLHPNGIGNGHAAVKNNNNNITNNNELLSQGQKLPNGLLDAVIGGLSEVATPVQAVESSKPKSSEWTASMEEASRLRRSRKQSRPRKLVMAALDPSEIQVLNEPMKRRRKRRWRKRRRKRLAERMRWLHSLQEAELHLPRIRVARRFPESLRGLRDKYVQHRKLIRASRWWRGPFHCAWCQEAGVTFRTRAGLALHDYWRHLRGAASLPPARIGRFECGQCGDRFPHQYQVVLHAGRVHVGNVTLESSFGKSAHGSTTSADSVEGTKASLSLLESLNSSSLAPHLGRSSPPPPPAPHLPKCDFPPHIQSSSPIPLSMEVNASYTSPPVPVANVVSALASS